MLVYPITQAKDVSEGDFEQIIGLMELRCSGYEDPASVELTRVFGHDTVLIVARERRGLPIFGLTTLFLMHDIGAMCVYVTRMVVPRVHRGKTIGIHMIREVMHFAKTRDVRQVCLVHPSGDVKADEVFREHGFLPSEELHYVKRL